MSDFRLWLLRMWWEHTEELIAYNQPINYSSADYFRKYKYWLKREYQFQKTQHNDHDRTTR